MPPTEMVPPFLLSPPMLGAAREDCAQPVVKGKAVVDTEPT